MLLLDFTGRQSDKSFKKEKSKKHCAFSIAEAMITLLIVSVALAAAAPIISKNINARTIDGANVSQLEKKVKQLEKNYDELNKSHKELDKKVDSNISSINSSIKTINNEINKINNKLNSIDISGVKTDIANIRNEINSLRNTINNNNQGNVPAGTIAFFDSANCPTGWTKVSANWNGRYPSFAGNYAYTTYTTNEGKAVQSGTANVTNNNVGSMYEDAIRNISGNGPSLVHYRARTEDDDWYYVNWRRESGVFTHKYYGPDKINLAAAGNLGENRGGDILMFNAARVVPTAAVNRPRTVVLLGCKKK